MGKPALRSSAGLWFWRLAPVWSIGLGLLVAALAVVLTGQSPMRAMWVVLDGALGTPYAVGATLVEATPLMLTGLSVAVAFKAGLFNIGAEGQLQVGAAAAAAVALALGSWSGPLALVLALAAAFVAGGIWGGIAGVLKATLKWHEIITTIMLNYVGLLIVNYLVNGPLLKPGENFPQSARIAAAAQLPMVFPGTRLHAGFLLAVALSVLLWYLITRSSWGFSLRILGLNPHVAERSGIPVPRGMALTMALAGGIAGLAGACAVLGVYFRLLDGLSPGYGYQGIAVAFLAGGNPLGVIPAAVFFGGIVTGTSFMQRYLQVPSSIMYIVQAVPVLFLTGTATLRRRALLAALKGGEDGD